MTNNAGPVKIEDRHLLAYLDGEADAQTAALIESSEEYLARARVLRRMQNRLKARLFRVDCPEATELGEYQLSLLGRKRAKAIKAHLAECPHCRRELDQLRAFLQAGTAQGKAHRLEGVKLLIARLLGEGQQGSASGGFGLGPAYAFVRGGSQGPVTLEAEGVLILLDIQPSDEGQVNLLGQVAADDQERWTGATVEVRRDEALLLTTSLDDLGAFRGKGLDPGLIELTITASEGTVILAAVEIRDE
jgi:hypothetical protein